MDAEIRIHRETTRGSIRKYSKRARDNGRYKENDIDGMKKDKNIIHMLSWMVPKLC